MDNKNEDLPSTDANYEVEICYGVFKLKSKLMTRKINFHTHSFSLCLALRFLKKRWHELECKTVTSDNEIRIGNKEFSEFRSISGELDCLLFIS